METTETTPTSPEITLPPGASLWNFWVTTLTRPKAEVYSALLDRYIPDDEAEERMAWRTVIMIFLFAFIRVLYVGLLAMYSGSEINFGLGQFWTKGGLTLMEVILMAFVKALSVLWLVLIWFGISLIARLFTDKGNGMRLTAMAGGYQVPVEMVRLIYALIIVPTLIAFPAILEMKTLLSIVGIVYIVGLLLFVVYRIIMDFALIKAVFEMDNKQVWGVLIVEMLIGAVYGFMKALFF